MSRMIFDLSDAEREALERVRIKLGARSHAETLRRLIVAEDEPPLRLEPDAKSRLHARIAASVKVAEPVRVSVPLHTPKAFNPQPKKGRKP